jgi:hypothetical protein
VRVTPQPSAPTAQNEAKRIQAFLSKRHVRLEEQDLTLAVGKTKRLRYELPFTTASRRVIRVHITYLCDHGASLCALTVIFPSDDRQSEAEADQMASTWRF